MWRLMSMVDVVRLLLSNSFAFSVDIFACVVSIVEGNHHIGRFILLAFVLYLNLLPRPLKLIHDTHPIVVFLRRVRAEQRNDKEDGEQQKEAAL